MLAPMLPRHFIMSSTVAPLCIAGTVLAFTDLRSITIL